jgi:hypothetical protein
MIHSNLKLLSHSGIVTLHKCPRRYELDRLSNKPPENDFHLSFGSVVGLGVQELLTHGSKERAYFQMFLEWDRMLDDENGVSKKKTFWFALHAVDQFIPIQRTLFGNMELAVLNGRPATEIGFSIDCGNGYYYRGFIDAVMFDRARNEIVILENKTTGNNTVNEASYKHSAQALGYSLIIDSICKQQNLEAKPSYQVRYPVYKSGAMEWEVLSFTKSHTNRALWIKNILVDINHLEEYQNDDYFPMHGEACYDFFRVCPHFGTCELSNSMLLPPIENIKLRENDEQRKSKHDFHFMLTDIINEQLQAMEA